jgi:endonuclease YncB( thermonuclease family)
MAKMIAGVASAGHDRTGNYIQINARTPEGEAVSLNMSVNVATSLNQMLELEIAKAHKARLTSDPTFRKVGSICPEEIKQVTMARDYTRSLVVGQVVTLTAVQPDKYDKRVDAYLRLPDGRDLGDALIAAGLARPYSGGHRAGWCD